MSTITVVGATGMVGTDIAREAAARGHRVIGINRSGKTDSPIDGVEYRAGDIADTAQVSALAEESDVIVGGAGGLETEDAEPGSSTPSSSRKSTPRSRAASHRCWTSI